MVAVSVTAKLESVFLRAPDPDACVRWREFGWREAPDSARLLREHEELAALLESAGTEVAYGDVVPEGLDAIYAFDPLLVTPRGAVLLRPGKELRRPEADAAEHDLARLKVRVAARLEPPATAEGGDLLQLDEKTILVGRGYRTNAAGVSALRSALPDVEFIEFDLPHFHGPGEVMHLLSLVNLVADNIALVYLPLLPVRLVQLLGERSIRIVEVPDEEFETMGPNVLALEPGVVLSLERNRETRKLLEHAGAQVVTYEGKELSKGDGGPTCLVLPLRRG
jgi:dimethylargininase